MAPINNEIWTDAQDLSTAARLLEYAWNSYNHVVDIFDKIDAKATSLAGFTGIIMTLSGGLLASGLFSDTNPKEMCAFLAPISRVLYAIFFSSLSATFAFCLATLSTRSSAMPSSAAAVVQKFRNTVPLETREQQVVKDMVNSISIAETSRRNNNTIKSKHLKHAFASMVASFIAGITGFATTLLLKWVNIN